MFNSALLALAATASLVVADDFKRTDGKGSCNVGDVKVCTGADFVLSLANNSLVLVCLYTITLVSFNIRSVTLSKTTRKQPVKKRI